MCEGKKRKSRGLFEGESDKEKKVKDDKVIVFGSERQRGRGKRKIKEVKTM